MVALSSLLLGSAPASARTVTDWPQVQVYSPSKVDAHVGWLAQAMFDLKKPARIRVGGTTFVGPWNNATITRGTMSETLKEIRGRYARESVAIYSDRALSASERSRFRVAAPLFRDADVLVLAAGHPACAGLTARPGARHRAGPDHALVAGRAGRRGRDRRPLPGAQREPGAALRDALRPVPHHEGAALPAELRSGCARGGGRRRVTRRGR